MFVATITSKGQVTIPKSVREAMRLQAGDRVEFHLSGEGEVRLRPINKGAEEVFGLLHKPGQKAVSVEQMNDAIQDRMRRHGS